MRLNILCAALLLVAGHSLAESSQPASVPADDVLDRLATAYGGKQLADLRSVTIESDRRLAWPGQGQTAGFVEYVTDRLTKHFDLENEAGSVERWTHQNGNVYHNRYVANGTGAFTIDYFDMSVEADRESGYWQSFNVDYRSSDLLLAHFMTTEDPDITYVGKETYQGRVHDVLEFSIIPETPRVRLYVSQNEGLIRRVFMDREIGPVNLLFSAHSKAGGVTYAGETHVFLGDTLTEYDYRLTVTPNLDGR